jgi:hypothetical protein
MNPPPGFRFVVYWVTVWSDFFAVEQNVERERAPLNGKHFLLP